ncbi:TonB-dependent receptor [Pseudoalteromonas tunicata]|nr:TonB-dependent receptor [Pseudoalteromonas tunicata]ATC96730.1 hypothetical protein PTUN_b0322 [Pseudoalteromonas tunicata]AXT32892.1 TonB-dependent receptor [Pseudoalteromonas tunicata]
MKLLLPSMTCKKTPLALCIASLLMTPTLSANTLVGTISDQQQKARFEGAKLELLELRKSTISGRDGAYRFNQLPAGTYTLKVSYLGAAPFTTQITISDNQVTQQPITLQNKSNTMDDILVLGQRAGQMGALNRQKNAANIKAIVSSDSIGQLPDKNAAEALQRLPGMFIARDQGEGRFVGIRGIDPNLNNVSINGVNVPSPEAGVRSVAMDVLPSELIQSLEVSKTVTADMDASAVGGSIEVKSLSAFDRQAQSYSLTVQGSHNQQVDKTSPKLSASFSDIYELNNHYTLGLATAVSWFKRDFGSLNMETDGGWGEFEAEDSLSGDDIAYFGAEEIEQRHYLITRERLGAALNLDLHSATNDKYYLRTLWSDFSDDEYRLRNEYKFAKGTIVSSGLTDMSAQFIDAKMDRDTKDRYEVQQILSVVGGAEIQLTDWFLEYNLGYSKSNEKEDNRLDVSFAGKGLDLGYQVGTLPRLNQSASAGELKNFELDEVLLANNLSEDKALSTQIDLSKEFVWQGYNSQLKFGAKYSRREKINKVDTVIYDGGFDDITAAQFSAAVPNYSLGAFGPGLNRQQLRDYVKANSTQFDINQNDTDIESLGQSYRSEEDILAAYIMLSLDIDQLDIITGMRYEGTQFSTKGHKVELVVDDVNDSQTVNITPWQVNKDYNYLLPSLNLRYQHSDKLISRFAATQTIARPTFSDSAAYALIETQSIEKNGKITTVRQAEVGNPELDPYKSINLDLSLEYYPSKVGVLSAGLFYKDIDNFISQQEVQDNGQWQGFKQVMQAVNGGSAALTGLELAWHKQFDSGFMFASNATLIDADAALPNQSDTVANLMLGFENSAVSTRLSVSYQSESYQFTENSRRVMQASHTQLDFSAKYYFNERAQVYFNATNLTDEPFYLYHGTASNNYQYEEYGRSFELGLTITSL